METPKVHKDFVPFRKGGLLACLIVAFYISGFSYLFWLICHFRGDKIQDEISLIAVFILAIVLVFASPLIYSPRPGETKSYLRKYFDRNVRGYNLHCWLQNGSLKTYVYRRGKGYEKIINAPPPNIVLPLGGWFNSCRVLTIHTTKKNLVAKGFHSMQEGEKKGWPIWLRDGERSRVRLGVEEALWVISESIMIVNYSIRLALEGRRERIRSLEEKIRTLKNEASTLNIKNFALLEAGLDTITRLEKTTRFIQSKQGKEIREWLVAKLATIEPSERRLKHLDHD